MAPQTISPEENRQLDIRRLERFGLILAIVAATIIAMGRLMNAPGLLLFTAKLIFLFAAAGAVCIPLGRRWLGESRTLEWVKNLALLVTTLAVMTVLAEFGLRVIFSGITTTSDNSSYWAKRWKATHVRLNHLGYREREFPEQKPPGVYRIAVVGDSFTFGQGIDEEDRYTNRLQVALDRRGRRFEVLNFGWPGAQTVDEVRILNHTVIRLRPDFVLLQWFINDVEGEKKFGQSVDPPLPLLPSETLRPLLHKHSVFYYILDRQWNEIQTWLGWNRLYPDYIRARFSDPNSAASREAAAALTQFVSICREANIPMGIVLFPTMDDIIGTVYPFGFLHDQVLARCSGEGIDCLDLRPSMRKEGRRVSLIVNRFDHHPNPEANRIAADEIMKRFRPIWDSASGSKENSVVDGEAQGRGGKR